MYKAYSIQEKDVKQLKESVEMYVDRTVEVNASNLFPKLSNYVKSVIFVDGELNAESIWNDWFPEIKADVFISHSSRDVEVAKKLSIYLKNKFGLKSFIDSEIWGHSDKLLEKIDGQHCVITDEKNKKIGYNYHKRNCSTAHVHMMLTYALTRMIDAVECFIFVESMNSIDITDAINGTYSPWIFHELATIDTIEIRKPKRQITETINFTRKVISESLKVKYPIFGKRLTSIDFNTFNRWEKNLQSAHHPLDILYSLTKIK